MHNRGKYTSAEYGRKSQFPLSPISLGYHNSTSSDSLRSLSYHHFLMLIFLQALHLLKVSTAMRKKALDISMEAIELAQLSTVLTPANRYISMLKAGFGNAPDPESELSSDSDSSDADDSDVPGAESRDMPPSVAEEDSSSESSSSSDDDDNLASPAGTLPGPSFPRYYLEQLSEDTHFYHPSKQISSKISKKKVSAQDSFNGVQEGSSQDHSNLCQVRQENEDPCYFQEVSTFTCKEDYPHSKEEKLLRRKQHLALNPPRSVQPLPMGVVPKRPPPTNDDVCRSF